MRISNRITDDDGEHNNKQRGYAPDDAEIYIFPCGGGDMGGCNGIHHIFGKTHGRVFQLKVARQTGLECRQLIIFLLPQGIALYEDGYTLHICYAARAVHIFPKLDIYFLVRFHIAGLKLVINL